MKDYLLLFRGGIDFATASPETITDVMAKWKTWMDGLAAQGKMVPGRRLKAEGAVVKKKEMIDGPFAEGKEIVSGYLGVKANDLQEAIQIAEGCPILDNDGMVEVREVVPPSF